MDSSDGMGQAEGVIEHFPEKAAFADRVKRTRLKARKAAYRKTNQDTASFDARILREKFAAVSY